MTDSLTPVQRTRLDFLIREAKKHADDSHESGVKCGKALIEIRDDLLYREKYKTFDEFTKTELGFERRYVDRQIGFHKVKLLPIGNKITNEAQAREIARIPEKNQAAVIATIEAAGEPITASNIRKASESQSQVVPNGPKIETNWSLKKNAEPESPKPEDCTGYIIPDQWVPLFNRANEVKVLRSKVSDVRCELRKAQDNGDLLYASMSVSMVMSELDAAYKGLEDAIPHAVCPYCQGQSASHCKVCKGRGIVSKRIYNDVADKDLIIIREKAIAQRKEKAK